MKKIALLLPTYNRAKLLQRLLDTIANVGTDTLSKIQLVVVDDGSTDHTEAVVASYAGKIDTAYIRVSENSGRAHAIREGLDSVTAEYVMILDSDDYFLKGALEVILDDLALLEGVSGARPVIGCCYRLLDTEGELLGRPYEQEKFVSSFYNVANTLGHGEDKKEVVATAAFKSNIYPVIADERRFPTSYIWDGISRNYDAVFSSRAVMIKTYRLDGMSQNLRGIKELSPEGSYLTYRQKYQMSRSFTVPFLIRVKFFLLMLRYGYLAAKNEEIAHMLRWYQRPVAVIIKAMTYPAKSLARGR